MTRRAIFFAAGGCAAYVAFLVTTAPASLVAHHLGFQTGGAVQLTDVRGTVWYGTARAILSPPRATPIDIERVEWRWQPARLVAGEIAFAASASARDFALDLVTARGFSGLEARDIAARADATRLATFLPLVATWQPGGTIRLSSARITISGGILSGDASLEWRGVSTALSEVRPLGSYKAEIKAAAGGASFRVATLEGPLTIQGTGTLALPSRATFTGEARPEPARAEALAPLLSLLGPRRADGAHAIEWRQ